MLLASGLSSVPSGAQTPAQSDADSLIQSGLPSDALAIMEGQRPTASASHTRALAHLMLAYRTTGALRCSHARFAYEYAAMASAAEIIERAQKLRQDERCPP